MNKKFALLLVLAFVLVMLQPFSLIVSAADAYTFDFTTDSSVIIIDQAFIDDKGTNNFIIPDEAYSVTVIGDVSVMLTFNEVTIDRTDTAGSNTTVDYSGDDNATLRQNLWDAGVYLHENYGWEQPTGGGYYVPTCPFLITGGATVYALFATTNIDDKDRTCRFEAGANGWYMASEDATSLRNVHDNDTTYRGGYAAIQVEESSSLVILGGKVVALGGYLFSGITGLDSAIEINHKKDTSDPYGVPSGLKNGYSGGGAGIGGGAAYNTTTASSTGYTAGTPGNIRIQNGKVIAVGGHMAAGIGGGVNSASTSGTIEINAGEIYAVGGRWAAAIGDGDSVSGATSTTYANEHEIIINGGTIEAYGGTASSGIGTTDNVSENVGGNQTHGLEITINGGSIKAQSGEPDAGNSSATAAIGAGQGTDMHPNSISIYSEAFISAVSFSRYAISNYGTDEEAIPVINLDPDGYMFMARFDEVGSGERTFHLYPVIHNDEGDPLLVEDAAYELMVSGYTPDASYLYAKDITYAEGKYYLTDSDGNALTQEAAEALGIAGEWSATDNKFYTTTIPELSYYYDTSTILETYTIPANYKAVAITLPDPTLYGGAYILHAQNAANDINYTDDAYALIEKRSPGTTSGEIIFNATANSYHVTYDNTGYVENPQMTEDFSAGPLSNLEAGAAGGENLIKFQPSAYGYTVYLPYGTTKFWFKFSFNTAYEAVFNDETLNVTVTDLNITSDKGEVAGSYDEAAIASKATDNVFTYESGDLEIKDSDGDGVLESAEIWIKKTDASGDGQNTDTISYKINFIVKEKYTLSIASLSKTYDKIPVEAQAAAMYVPGTGITSTVYNKDAAPSNLPYTNSSWDEEYAELHASLQNSQTISNSFNLRYNAYRSATVTYTIEYVNYNAASDGAVDFDIMLTSGRYSTTVYVKYNPTTEVILFRYNNDATTASLGNFTVRDNLTTTSDGIKKYSLVVASNTANYSYDLLTFCMGETVHSEQDVPEAQTFDSVLEAQSAKQQALVGDTPTSVQDESRIEYTQSIAKVVYECHLTDYGDNYNEAVLAKVSGTITTYSSFGLRTEYVADKDMTSLLTATDRANIKYTYYYDNYADTENIGILDENDTELEDAPYEAGMYIVKAELVSDTYEAEGILAFNIYRRVISIVAIENWLRYVGAEDFEDGKLKYPTIDDTGDITYTNVVEDDEIVLESITAQYNNSAIGYGVAKILLTDVVLADTSLKNYRFDYIDEHKYDDNIPVEKKETITSFYVPGQLSYTMDRSVFRKTDSGTDHSLWRKYYPTDSETYIDFFHGDGENGPLPTYNSPYPYGTTSDDDTITENRGIHRDYVKLRTVNNADQDLRYAVDVEFGAMEFVYTKTVWDVNTYQFVEVNGGASLWEGDDGVNNLIKVINRSNAMVYCTVESTISFEYAAQIENYGIRSSLEIVNTDDITATKTSSISDSSIYFALDGADENEVVYEGQTAMPSGSSVAEIKLEISGVPQFPEMNGSLMVGSITVTVSNTEKTADTST